MSPARGLCLLLAAAAGGAARQAADGLPLKVPFYKQQKNGCGAASAAMVVHYWTGRSEGRTTAAPSPGEVHQRLFDEERRGVTLSEMRRYFEELGFHAFTFRGQWSDLQAHLGQGRPLIVGLRKTAAGNLHFAVVTGIDGARVWLHDPTRKQAHRRRQADFEKEWESGGRWVLLATPRVAE